MPSSAGGDAGLHSFPTRRSSDLLAVSTVLSLGAGFLYRVAIVASTATPIRQIDRKSTRLNSSHLGISYAVLCGGGRRFALVPYTTLFRSTCRVNGPQSRCGFSLQSCNSGLNRNAYSSDRSEEHTSELQSLRHLVCRPLRGGTPVCTRSLHDALPIYLPCQRSSVSVRVFFTELQ